MAEKIEPRHRCLVYVTQQKVSIERESGKMPTVELITKVMFDSLVRDGKFIDGPFMDGFGEGGGEPYYPWGQIYGTVEGKDCKKIVYSEVHKMMQASVSVQLQPIR